MKCMLYKNSISVLIDNGANECFLSPKLLSRFPKRTSFMVKSSTVEYANQVRDQVEKCLFEVRVELLGVTIEVNLYVAPFGSYDVILGMNWLWEHRAKEDYSSEVMECLDDLGNRVLIKGIQHGIRVW